MYGSYRGVCVSPNTRGLGCAEHRTTPFAVAWDQLELSVTQKYRRKHCLDLRLPLLDWMRKAAEHAPIQLKSYLCCNVVVLHFQLF